MNTAQRDNMDRLPVLMYHRVVEEVRPPNAFNTQISVGHFDAQMRYLRDHGYDSIGLEDVPHAIRNGSRRRKIVAISFDDGYRDTYSHAWPILKKYGLTATVMLVTDCIGGHNRWDYGKTEMVPLLSVGEIREMDQAGLSFRAHGRRHLSLPELPVVEAQNELAGSKRALEDLLGREISTFAYPYGRSSPTVCRLACEAGFAMAFGVDALVYCPFAYSRTDAAAFPGVSVEWRLKIAGVHYQIRKHWGVRVPNRFRQSARRQLRRLRLRLAGDDA